MRILTLKQPYAHAVIHGGKDVENRTTRIAGDYRGLVLIHAGKTFAKDAPAQLRSDFLATDEAHVYGAIIGVVELVDVHTSAECWERDEQRLLDLYRSARPVFDARPDNGAGGVIGKVRHCSPWALEDHFHLALANPRALDEPIPYRGALGLRAAPFAIAGDWLVEQTDTCTCGPGPNLGAVYGHEPGCGWEHAARLTNTGGAG